MKKNVATIMLFLSIFLSVSGLEIPALPQGGLLKVDQAGSTVLEIPLKELRNAQDRIQFLSSAGRKNASDATLTVSLLVRGGNGKERVLSAKSFPAHGILNQDLSLNGTFQLQDATYPVSMLRFTLRSGRPASLRIGSLRLGTNDELTAAETDYRITSAYRKPLPRRIEGLSPVRVYFDFDNTDNDTKIKAFPAKTYLPDANPSGGFATLLLESADGIVERADNPESADVIVYSRARKSPVETLPALIRSGKRLIVYGASPDPELSALLPLSFEERNISGTAKRERALRSDPEHPVFKGQILADTDFGRYQTVRKKSGKSILAFESGEPLAVESGGILHFATGIGTHLLPSDGVYYDRSFLRAVCARNPAALNALEARLEEERKSRATKETRLLREILGKENVSGWRVGMSENNFGRFGWLIGEGVLCGTVGRDLTVANGPQYYRFDNSGQMSAAFHHWKHKILKGKIRFRKSTPENTDPLERWSGIGTVEYSAELEFNREWRGKPLFFDVEEGIDDTDEVFFNGVRIGATGIDTPRYWSVRRAYPIPASAVRWGQANAVSVRVTNLRGDSGFNSAPRIQIGGGKISGSIHVASTDWTHKKYEIEMNGRRREMVFSLLSPFILNRFPQNDTFLALEEKTAQYAAYSTGKGIRVVRLEKQPDFYRLSRDGAWNAPWVLLFRKNWERARPLLLVFEKQPHALDAELNDRFVGGIRIQSKRPLGTILTGWPWGVTPVNASKWTEKLPPEVIGHLEHSLSLALNYPVGCDEAFRVDRPKKQIEIANRFRYLRTRDEWNTPVRTLATLPPLVGFALEKKKYVLHSEDPVRFLNLNTTYGPLWGIDGASRISYALPLPPEDDLMLTGVTADPELRTKINQLFEGGIRWSRGGRVRQEEFTYAYPEGEKRDPAVIGIPLFQWTFGLSVSLQGYFILTPENRLKLQDRIRNRFLRPLEQYQYKYIYRNRQEPFTGLRYPSLFTHSHPNSTRYAPGIGSPVITGDNNEGCTMLAWLGRQCSDALGQRNALKNSWSFVQYGMRNSIVLDDYAWHASGCREFGSGAWIDMLNGEYAGFLHYAQLARNVGDRRVEDEALYRAAKRGIPTLMRLYFLDYVDRAMPQIPLSDAGICTGFSETGVPLMRFPNKNKNFFAANDLFDFSQGFPGALHWLYTKHSLPEIRTYLHRYAFPSLLGSEFFRSDYLSPLMLYADREVPVRGTLDEVLRKQTKGLMSDWPGIRQTYLCGLYFYRTNGRIALKEFRLLTLRDAEYNPATKCLKISCSAVPESRLVIGSDLPLQRVLRNGQEIRAEINPGTISLPLLPGSQRFEVYFQ